MKTEIQYIIIFYFLHVGAGRNFVFTIFSDKFPKIFTSVYFKVVKNLDFKYRYLKSRDKFTFPRSSLNSCYFLLGFLRIPTLKILFRRLCDIYTVVFSDNKYNGRLNLRMIRDRTFSTLSGRRYRGMTVQITR